MGAVERDIDRHADEEGERQAREDYAEQRFKDERADLAEQLAAGNKVSVNEHLTLEFETVMNNLFFRDEQLETGLRLCMVNSGLGGIRLKRIITEIAQEVVDERAGEFKGDFENDY